MVKYFKNNKCSRSVKLKLEKYKVVENPISSNPITLLLLKWRVFLDKNHSVTEFPNLESIVSYIFVVEDLLSSVWIMQAFFFLFLCYSAFIQWFLEVWSQNSSISITRKLVRRPILMAPDSQTNNCNQKLVEPSHPCFHKVILMPLKLEKHS